MLLAGVLLIWRAAPLPTARWRVERITVDGERVVPLRSSVTTGMGRITFRGCNEIGASVGGLPWRPRVISSSTTAVYCPGPRGDLDQIWWRLTRSDIAFDGAWRDRATLRGGGVRIELVRRA